MRHSFGAGMVSHSISFRVVVRASDHLNRAPYRHELEQMLTGWLCNLMSSWSSPNGRLELIIRNTCSICLLMVTKPFVFSMATIILQMKLSLKLITQAVQSSSPSGKTPSPTTCPPFASHLRPLSQSSQFSTKHHATEKGEQSRKSSPDFSNFLLLIRQAKINAS